MFWQSPLYRLSILVKQMGVCRMSCLGSFYRWNLSIPVSRGVSVLSRTFGAFFFVFCDYLLSLRKKEKRRKIFLGRCLNTYRGRRAHCGYSPKIFSAMQPSCGNFPPKRARNEDNLPYCVRKPHIGVRKTQILNGRQAVNKDIRKSRFAGQTRRKIPPRRRTYAKQTVIQALMRKIGLLGR